MTNPTSNFGWQMPTSTDLVTDLPADFETFGQAVDTSLADLKGGTSGQVLSKASNTDMDFTWVAQDDSNAVQNTIVDAKGDLIAASAADTPARLAVGTNGQVLSADSTASTGLAWVADESYTLLSTTTLSTTSTTVSSISGNYKHLFIYAKGITSTTNGDGLGIRYNGDTGSNYNNSYIRSLGSTLSGFSLNTTAAQLIQRLQSSSTVQKLGYAAAWIYRYTSTDHIDVSVQSRGNDGTDGVISTITSTYDASAAITSITFFADSGGTLGGTIYIYGVK